MVVACREGPRAHKLCIANRKNLGSVRPRHIKVARTGARTDGWPMRGLVDV